MHSTVALDCLSVLHTGSYVSVSVKQNCKDRLMGWKLNYKWFTDVGSKEISNHNARLPIKE